MRKLGDISGYGTKGFQLLLVEWIDDHLWVLRFRVMVGPGDRGAVGSIDRRADYGDALSGLLC